jgi:hypothetical protein
MCSHGTLQHWALLTQWMCRILVSSLGKTGKSPILAATTGGCLKLRLPLLALHNSLSRKACIYSQLPSIAPCGLHSVTESFKQSLHCYSYCIFHSSSTSRSSFLTQSIGSFIECLALLFPILDVLVSTHEFDTGIVSDFLQSLTESSWMMP